MTTITYEEFENVNLRSGTTLKVEEFPRAKKPAFKVWADFGPEVGILQTSAQVTVHYTPETLIGRQIMGCINLGEKNIAGFTSQFLLVGFAGESGAICLITVRFQMDKKCVDGNLMTQVIIFGSSRSFGNTRKVIDDILDCSGTTSFDLNNFDISPFDYEHRNQSDYFIPLIEKLLDYDTWIIATPVYWYNMSTQHKIFFDRFSDLLTIRKDLGRKLRGKKLFVIASFGDSYPKGFEDTFEQICQYLGMEYLASRFLCSGTKNEEYLSQNKSEVAKAKIKLGIVNELN